MYQGIKSMSSTSISYVIKVERLICHGCEAYLAFVTTSTENKLELSKIPVVQDFSDLFLKELSNYRL